MTKISVKTESEVVTMAEKKVKLQMSKGRKYQSCTRYAVANNEPHEVWERIYVHHTALEEIGNPAIVTVTIEANGVPGRE